MGSKKRYDTFWKNSQKGAAAAMKTHTLFVKSLKTCSYRSRWKCEKSERNPPVHKVVVSSESTQCLGLQRRRRTMLRHAKARDEEALAVAAAGNSNTVQPSRRCDVVTEIPTTYCTAVAVDTILHYLPQHTYQFVSSTLTVLNTVYAFPKQRSRVQVFLAYVLF